MFKRVKEQKRLEFGLKHTHAPKAKEKSRRLGRIPAGSKVLVYRNERKRWTGPFIFISMNGETVVIKTRKGRRIYRSTSVKPYNESAIRLPGEESKQIGSKDAFIANKDTVKKTLSKKEKKAIDYRNPRKLNSKASEGTGL